MTLPPLPSRIADAWDMGPAFDKTGPIFSVSAHAGRVLVGGAGLHRLRAGDQSWQQRELPPRISLVWNAAQEAVASEEGVAIFLGKEGDGRIAHIRPAARDATVTNLAWGRVGQRSALLVLWDNGEVIRLYPEKGEQDALELPPMAALAGDGNGSVAMLAWEELTVYVTDGSQRAQFRRIEFPKDWYDALPETIDSPFHLAVAGKAVALSVGWEGAFLTRDLESMPFVKCEPLSLAGALCFDGSSPDAALGEHRVVDVDRPGGCVRPCRAPGRSAPRARPGAALRPDRLGCVEAQGLRRSPPGRARRGDGG